ncbi:MAG: Uma2 family endonuclease [Flavobacteriales bacterium]|nr:Uma2 family endonuclease [Flavobacteriales bacterium]
MKVEEPIASYGMLDESKEYTYAEYLTWKFKERVELIRGRIKKMAPAPSLNHQDSHHNTLKIFDTYFEKKSCRVYYAPVDVVLFVSSKDKKSTVVQPDICVLCDLAKRDNHGIIGTPDLIVEILSPGNTKYDLDTKFRLYEEAKLPEYWIISPMEHTILVYTLVDDVFIGSKVYTEGETAVSKHFAGLKVEVSKVFEGVHTN